MTDLRITDFADGGAVQATDEFLIARAGANYKIAGSKVGPVKIFDSLLGADAASIDTGAGAIPAGYSGLMVMMQLRTDEASAVSNALLRFNADIGANYYSEDALVNNTTLTGERGGGLTSLTAIVHGAGGSANFASAIRMLIPNYDGTAFFKSFEYTEISNDATAGNNFYRAHGATWASTAAITRLSVAAASGNLKAGSRLTIHGLP
jgi:hypothetical protein